MDTKNKNLRSQSDKFKKLFDFANNFIIVIGRNKKVQYINPFAANLLGYDKNEIIGKNWFENFLPPEVKIKTEQYFDNLIESNEIKLKPVNINPILTKNGQEIMISWKNTILKDNRGGIIASLSFGENLTEKEKLREALCKQQQLFQKVAELSPVGLTIVDKDGKIIFANKQAEEALGLSKESILQRTYDDHAWKITKVDGSPFPKENLPFHQVLRKKKPVYGVKHAIESPKKERTVLSVNANPLFDKNGEIDGVITTVEDITEMVEIQQNLKASEKQYRNAYKQMKLYEDLFAHDINNILQILLSSVELTELVFKKPTIDKKKVQNILQILKSQVIRGKQLTSNVVKLTSIDELGKELKKINYHKILTEAIKNLKNTHEKTKIQMDVKLNTENHFVKANILLHDVIYNILMNAVEFSDNDIIRITINISEVEKNGSKYIKFEFIDYGKGIEDSRKNKIFNRLKRENRESTRIGLGLSLVKMITDMVNGKIWVEDRVEGDHRQGSNFVLLLPAME